MTNASRNLLFGRFTGNPPTSREEIERVQRKLSFRLPNDYVEFMLTKNGGEGFIGKSYLVLWKIEELISMNNAYHVAEFASDLFLFGSDGGGEAFGFDTRSEAPRIVSIPFVAMEIEDAKVVATDFESFLSALFTS
jgi:hypothetical protein